MSKRSSQWEWVFGLSIDDEITWAATRVNLATGEFTTSRKDIIHGELAYPPQDIEVDLHEHLAGELRRLSAERPILFRDCLAVGVSTIGLADRSSNRLMSIARKNWGARHKGCAVDFNSLFGGLFARKISISIQNDATAKCLAEYHWFHRSLPSTNLAGMREYDTMCYALFHEGVNGGFVNGNITGDGQPVASLFHQEMGHIYPSLHPRDLNFSLDHSGCPVHGLCFEGVASSERVRKQWGKPLSELRDHEDEPWDIISHYISHFCWNIILTIPPKRIFIGGNLVFPELIDMVRRRVDQLNVGLRDKPYIQYAELSEPDSMAMARIPRGAEGQAGALELARLAVINMEPAGIDPLTDRGLKLVVNNEASKRDYNA